MVNSSKDEKDETDIIATIQEVNENDIFLGRGGTLWKKEGNRKLRDLCHSYNHKYNNVQKSEKPLIAKSIVYSIKAVDPPGRFLKRLSESSENSSWVEVGDSVATEKVSQVLRDIRRGRRAPQNSRSFRGGRENIFHMGGTSYEDIGACTPRGASSHPMMFPTSPQTPEGLIYPFQHHQYSYDDSIGASTSNTSCTDDNMMMYRMPSIDSANDRNGYFSPRSAPPTYYPGPKEVNPDDRGYSPFHYNPHQLTNMNEKNDVPTRMAMGRGRVATYPPSMEPDQGSMYHHSSHQNRNGIRTHDEREGYSLMHGRNESAGEIVNDNNYSYQNPSHMSPAGQYYYNHNGNDSYGMKNNFHHQHRSPPANMDFIDTSRHSQWNYHPSTTRENYYYRERGHEMDMMDTPPTKRRKR